MIGQIGELRWIECQSYDAEDIPASSIVEVVDVEFTPARGMRARVKKPSEDNIGPLAVTYPYLMGLNGLCTMEGPVAITYDTADLPTSNEAWGVKKDTFELTKDFGGFIVVGEDTEESGKVIAQFNDYTWRYKPFIDFELESVMLTSDATHAATIVKQWGTGIDNPNILPDDITLHNMETMVAGVYTFWGVKGKRGRADHLYGNHYLIKNMECP